MRVVDRLIELNFSKTGLSFFVYSYFLLLFNPLRSMNLSKALWFSSLRGDYTGLTTTIYSDDNPESNCNDSVHPSKLYFNLISFIIPKASISGLYFAKFPFFKNYLALERISSSKNSTKVSFTPSDLNKTPQVK